MGFLDRMFGKKNAASVPVEKPSAPAGSPAKPPIPAQATRVTPSAPTRVPQQTSAEPKPWVIGDARVVSAFTASAANMFRQQGFIPIDFAAVGLAQDSGSSEQVLKQPDGKLRLHPSRRNQLASMRVYSDEKGSVIVTDKPLDQPASMYKLEGKLNLMSYVAALCQKLGIAPESFLQPEVIETLSGPSRTWRCPQCGHLLTKGMSAEGASRFDTIIGTATCAYCQGEVQQSDVYSGRYDVPQIKVRCPYCREAWEGPAELLLGKPCRKCKAELPLD